MGGLELRFPSFHPTLFTTAPRIPLLNEKFEQIKSKLFSKLSSPAGWLFLLLYNQTKMKLLHTNSSKILLLTIYLVCIESAGKEKLKFSFNNISETYMCIELMFYRTKQFIISIVNVR